MFEINTETRRNLEIWGILFGVVAALTTIAFNIYRLRQELKADEEKQKLINAAQSGTMPKNVEFLGLTF